MTAAHPARRDALCKRPLTGGIWNAFGRTLRATALAEIAIYRDVSTAVMAHLDRMLGWSGPKAAVLAAGIQALYLRERLGGWRRMVTLRMPARRNALGGPAGTPHSRVGTGGQRETRGRNDGLY